jgi:hypothetical protein
MQSRRLGFVAITLAALAASASAAEYRDATVVGVRQGKLGFRHEGKLKAMTISGSLKVVDDAGQELDAVKGLGLLLAGNVVHVTTAKDEACGGEQVVAVTFVSGKTAEVGPSENKEDLLLPAAEWKGEVPEFGMPKEYLAYFPTAKAGDFVLRQGSGRARLQVMEVGEDYLVEARVVTLFGSPTEQRWKYKLSDQQKKALAALARQSAGDDKPAASDKKSAAKTKPARPKPAKTAKGREIQKQIARDKARREAAAKKAEEDATQTKVFRVGSRELECKARKTGENIVDWIHPDVPLDGIVRHEAPDASYRLIDFGRGK